MLLKQINITHNNFLNTMNNNKYKHNKQIDLITNTQIKNHKIYKDTLVFI